MNILSLKPTQTPVTHRSILISLLAIYALFSSTSASATNGYFTHGIGPASKAMAGAGDARPSMAIDAANNPASGALLEDSTDAGLGLFAPYREYSVSDSMANGQGGAFTLQRSPETVAGTVKSERNLFPIPHFAKNWRLSSDSAVTLAFYGRGGMNTTYRTGAATFDPDGPGPAPVMTLEGTFGAGNAGVNLSQAFLELAYSTQVGDLTLGIAPVLAYQMFEAEGLATFTPYTETYVNALLSSGQGAPVENLSNRDTDSSYGFGVKLGAIWSLNDDLNLSLAYASKIGMTEFDDYSDLFAESGGFDIPSNIRVGASYRATESWTINADIERTYYSDVASVSNPSANVFACPTAGQGGTDVSSCLGGDNGFGFGWQDITTYQMGFAWQQSADRVIRFGYSVGDQPIKASDVLINTLAPGVIEQHLTAGFTQTLSSGNRVSLALMYAFENSVRGPSLFDPTQTIELSMDQFELEFSYSF